MPEVDPKRKKNLQELIDRMGKGFDENLLDPLVESIVTQPEQPLPSESKVKAKKIKYKVIEVAPTGQGESLAEFLGAKVGESFSMAAKARRADKGLKKRPMFYLGKALTNQFGGDLVNRTKGYFSANPDDTQDPALSRSQRFTASVQPFMNEQGPLAPPVQGPQRSGIAGAFDRVAARLDELIDLKKNKSEQSKVANEIQQVEVKEATEEIKENNDLKKKSTEIKKDFIAFNREQQGDAEILEVEDTAEERDPMADTLDIDNRRDDDEDEEDDGRDDRSMLDRALDFITGDDYLLDAGAEGAERVAGRVGRRGARRFVTRTAIKFGGKKFAQRAAVKGAQAVVTKAATALAPKAVLGFLRPIFKRIPIVGGLIDFVVSLAMGEPVGRAAAKAIGATLGGALGSLIPIPGVGTIAGGIVGDLVGGAIYDAVTGGAPPEPTGATPEEAQAAGAPTSYADQSGGLGSPDPVPAAPPEKLASGGFLAGEAGPEYKFDLSSKEGKDVVKKVAKIDNSALSAAPFIIGITQQMLDRMGSDVAPIRAYISQEMAPLEKLFGAANFNVSTDVKDAPKSNETKEEKKFSILGGFNLSGGKKKGKGKQGGAEAAETMTGAPVTPVNVPSSRKERAKLAFNFYKSKGFSDSGAAYMVGNLLQESGLDPAANGDSGKAWGIAQWREDAASGARWLTYKQWATSNGYEVGDLMAQLEYTIVEGNQYNNGLVMMKGDNVEDHKKFVKAYEGYSEEGNRFGYAQDIINNISEYKGGPTPSAPTPTSVSPSSSNDEEENQPGPVPEAMSTPPAAAPTRKRTQGSTAGVAARQRERETGTPGPDPSALAPLPAPLAAAEKMQGVIVQPIIIKEGGSTVGYLKSVDTGEGTSKMYYNTTGQRTTLEALKRARLQTN